MPVQLSELSEDKPSGWAILLNWESLEPHTNPAGLQLKRVAGYPKY